MRTPSSTIPLKGLRGMTAAHMVESLATAAQLTHHATADASHLREQKRQLSEAGTIVSVEDLLLAAVVRALKQHPHANGRVVGNDIHYFDEIDISVAISLPNNSLVAPAISGVGEMTVQEISAARRDLVKRAKSNKVSVSEMKAGTFTVSNLGLTRVESFTPIINLPQICILGIGCMVDRAVRGRGGEIEFRPTVGLSLTFDHRAIDGAPAGYLLTSVCEEIERAEHSTGAGEA